MSSYNDCKNREEKKKKGALLFKYCHSWTPDIFKKKMYQLHLL